METLVYYDGPEVVLAYDQLSTRYICVLVERLALAARYLCAPVSPERSLSLLSGNADLRSVFVGPEVSEFYTLEVSTGDERPLLLAPVDQGAIPEGWLPSDGFYISDLKEDERSLVTKAQHKNRAVIELSLEPPESAVETKIRAANLGYALTVFQTLVKHAYHKSISGLSAKTRRFLDQDDNFDVEVLGFQPGSFQVLMQSRSAPDLTGYTEIARALRKIDEIMSPRDDLEQQKEVLKNNAGHLLKAFEKFIKLAIDFNSAVAYSWAIPESPEVNSRRLSRRQAEPIYTILSETQELSVEKVVLRGRMTRADYRTGLWTLLNEDDEVYYSGRTDPSKYVSLSGVTIESKRYQIECAEHLIEETVTGREKTQLYLVSFKEL
jgi:hypothetical protein